MEPGKSKSVEGTVKVTSSTEELKQEVKSKLAAQNDDVKAVVVDKMVKEEKEKRVTLLEKAFEELTKLESELKKLVPDIFSADDTSKGLYSSALLKQRTDLEGKIKRFETALNKAINEKDWSSLKELVGSPKVQQ